MDATDAELLAAFARNRDEDAFRELVRRHLGMVFATARRLVGDAHEAEEIAQTVFQLFAEKAGTIGAGQSLAGWLYHAARHHALHRVRSEGRRRQREQLAAAMNPATESAPLPPLLAELEDALTELPADERDTLVLRFLEDRQLREVGRELGVSEEAARKRVARALDRLRDVFARRGITASTGAITVALLGQAGVGVPAGLGATISTTVLGGTAVAAATALVTETTTTTMNLFNLKTAAAILGAAAVTGTTTYLVQEREADRLRADYQTLSETHGKLTAEQLEARAMIQLRDEQIAALKRDVGELPRLRGEVDRLNRDLSARNKLEEENRSLMQELQQLLASQRPAENGLGTPVTKDSLVFAGFASPESTLLSALWGTLNGDFDVFLRAMDESTRADFLRNRTNGLEFESRSREFSRYFVAAQILARKELDSDHVELLYRWSLDRTAGNPPPDIDAPGLLVTPFIREGGEWKAQGTTNPTPDLRAWERDGRVIRYAR